MRSSIVFTFIVVLLMSFQSCITDSYDFKKDMELSVHFSDNGFTIGGTNSADVPLSQIIELKDSGQLTTDDAGNYLFYKSDSEMEPTEVTIGQGSLGLAVDTTLIYHIKTGDNTEIKAGRFLSDITFSHRWDISYKNDRQGSSIRDFSYISTQMVIGVYSSFNEVSDFTDNVTLTYDIPSYYDIEDESQLKETLKPSDMKGIHYHEIRINGVDFKRATTKEGEKIGFDCTTGDIIMKGGVKISASARILLSDYNRTIDPYMQSQIVVGSMNTTSVTGRFDKSENIDLDPIEFDNLPKFIQDDEVVVDVENPVVRITLDNEVPANVKMDAVMRGFKNGSRISWLGVGESYGTDAIEFEGADALVDSKRTNVWISRIPTETPDSVKKNVVVSNMMNIIKTVPDWIDVMATARTDSSQIVKLELGKKYLAKPTYELVAPLKIGPNMKIVYTTELDSLQDKLDDMNVGEIVFTADVENNIPLDLSVKVYPVSKNGTVLDDIDVDSSDVIPGISKKSVTFRLKNTSYNQMKNVDRIRIKAYAESNENMVGKYLNKNQNVRLDNVKLQIKDTSVNF